MATKDEQIRAFLAPDGLDALAQRELGVRRPQRKHQQQVLSITPADVLAWVGEHGLPAEARITREDGAGGGIHLVRDGMRWQVYVSERGVAEPPERFWKLRPAELHATEILLAYEQDLFEK